MPPDPSPARKAVTYAEENLGVHDTYKEAVTARNSLDECLTRLAELKDLRRTYENTILDREMDLSADERSKHADMSDAGIGRHLKVVYHLDSVLREAHNSLTVTLSDLEGKEFDRSVIETDIKIALARLNELNGYLQYLAAIKLNK